MKKYTLLEIRNELNKEISELYEKEPFWRKCISCPFKGKCCIDNDVDIRDDEWKEIKNFLLSHPKEFQQVKENYLYQRKCYFRTPSACILKELRPLNCLYTPYQIIQNVYTGRMMYHVSTNTCDFEYHEDKSDLIADLPYLIRVNNQSPFYLFLNYWIKNYYSQSDFEKSKVGEIRIKELLGELENESKLIK